MKPIRHRARPSVPGTGPISALCTLFVLGILAAPALADPAGSGPVPGAAGDGVSQQQVAASASGPTILTDAELDDVTAGFLSSFRLSIGSINRSIQATTRSVSSSFPSSCVVASGVVFGNCSSP